MEKSIPNMFNIIEKIARIISARNEQRRGAKTNAFKKVDSKG